jgi:hypothetical protein
MEVVKARSALVKFIAIYRQQRTEWVFWNSPRAEWADGSICLRYGGAVSKFHPASAISTIQQGKSILILGCDRSDRKNLQIFTKNLRKIGTLIDKLTTINTQLFEKIPRSDEGVSPNVVKIQIMMSWVVI